MSVWVVSDFRSSSRTRKGPIIRFLYSGEWLPRLWRPDDGDAHCRYPEEEPSGGTCNEQKASRVAREECKKFAEDCLIWAKTARSETERTVFWIWRVPALSRQLIANTRMLDRAGGLSARLDSSSDAYTSSSTPADMPLVLVHHLIVHREPGLMTEGRVPFPRQGEGAVQEELGEGAGD